MTRYQRSKICSLFIGVACSACGGGALETALDVKDATRKPDGVLLEPAPAVPPAEEHGKAQAGVVALRQPVSDEQIGELARDYVRAYVTGGGQISSLLTDDAVLFGDNGKSTPRVQLVSFALQRYQQHVQDYRNLRSDVARLDKLERWSHDDLGPHTEPARPSEMRNGDVLARLPLDPKLSSAGDPLFRNTLVMLVRRGPDRKLKIAGLAETDAP